MKKDTEKTDVIFRKYKPTADMPCSEAYMVLLD